VIKGALQSKESANGKIQPGLENDFVSPRQENQQG
jgi:hypothetical protein